MELRDPQNAWITVADVERWMKAAGARANNKEWAFTFREGFLQGITAVMGEMDDEIKRRRKIAAGTNILFERWKWETY